MFDISNACFSKNSLFADAHVKAKTSSRACLPIWKSLMIAALALASIPQALTHACALRERDYTIPSPSFDVVFNPTPVVTHNQVRDIPEVKQLFSGLNTLLEDSLDNFGKMPETNEEQHLFAQNEMGRFQAWTNQHFTDLLKMKSLLPQPDSTKRYGRNLVFENTPKGIYVFLHMLQPRSATPKHWHSQNEVDSLAFATTITSGGVETKWKQEKVVVDPHTSQEYVQLIDEEANTIPMGRLGAIPGDYGSHQISNQSDEPLMLFEIYFEPKPMDHIDVPVAVMGSLTDHIVDTVSVTWLNERNLKTTASRENWPEVAQKKAEGLVLAKDSKVFTIIEGETVFVPLSLRQQVLVGNTKVLQGPNNRLLII